MVTPRTVRAYCTQFDNPIAATTTQMATCSWISLGSTVRARPSISKATKIVGKLSCTSARRRIKLSRRPPAYPLNRPSVTPMSIDNTVAVMATISDTRKPYNITDSKSRPWPSVPNQYIGAPPPNPAAPRAVRAEPIHRRAALQPGRRHARIHQIQGGGVEGVLRRQPGCKQGEHCVKRQHRSADQGFRAAQKAVTQIRVAGALQKGE